MLVAVLLLSLATLETENAAGASPAQVVASFHDALRQGSPDAALSLLLEDALIFEQGRTEKRDEYAAHHLRADMQFATSVTRELIEQSQQVVGDVAWVTSRTRSYGQVGGRDVDASGAETVVLRRSAGSWRISHIHWSSVPSP